MRDPASVCRLFRIRLLGFRNGLPRSPPLSIAALPQGRDDAVGSEIREFVLCCNAVDIMLAESGSGDPGNRCFIAVRKDQG